MEEILQLMVDYSTRHFITYEVTLVIETDGSGEIQNFLTNDKIFNFESINDLKEKLIK
jgi:hypothetical protein